MSCIGKSSSMEDTHIPLSTSWLGWLESCGYKDLVSGSSRFLPGIGKDLQREGSGMIRTAAAAALPLELLELQMEIRS